MGGKWFFLFYFTFFFCKYKHIKISFFINIILPPYPNLRMPYSDAIIQKKIHFSLNLENFVRITTLNGMCIHFLWHIEAGWNHINDVWFRRWNYSKNKLKNFSLWISCVVIFKYIKEMLKSDTAGVRRKFFLFLILIFFLFLIFEGEKICWKIHIFIFQYFSFIWTTNKKKSKEKRKIRKRKILQFQFQIILYSLE